MTLFGVPQSPAQLVKIRSIAKSIQQFESKGDFAFFTCAEYCPEAERLITGGSDGLIRVWFTHKTALCEYALKGHQKPVIDIVCNNQDKLIVSLSTDFNVRLWTEHGCPLMKCLRTREISF
uniref:Uncharacterized protein n=1 Tax=Echeneis naucrates TaxID=173247 RepID=A0A665WXN9_ECHNA